MPEHRLDVKNRKGPEGLCDRSGELFDAPHFHRPAVLVMRDAANWLGDDERDIGGLAGLLPVQRPRDNDHLDLPGHFKCPICGKFELRFGTGYSEHGSISADKSSHS